MILPSLVSGAFRNAARLAHCCVLASPVRRARIRNLASQRIARYRCLCSASSSAKHRLVFLGTPEVAAEVLQGLIAASDSSDFEVVGVVTQPGRAKGRGKKSQSSPVDALAIEQGIPRTQILCPISAREAAFLTSLQDLKPDLCVTAAYGNILPKAFLAIPRFGTLNIHPSLLPKYRGAAPVQRAVQDGAKETGVSVAFTVRAMDAGPVLAQQRSPVDPNIQAPELLSQLFAQGTQLLLRSLPDVWTGRAAELATPQDEGAATHAAKLTKEEGVLDFREDACTLHNKVRAFAGWPGTSHDFIMRDPLTGASESLPMKVVRTSIAEDVPSEELELQQVAVSRERMLISCGGGSWLEVLEVQPAGKKAMPAAAFYNGLKGRKVFHQ